MGESGFVVIPLAEGTARFTFEFECSPSPMVAAFTYTLDFHCCFGQDCVVDSAQSTGYVSSRGSVVYVRGVGVAVYCLVATALTLVGTAALLVIGKLLEWQNEEHLKNLIKEKGEGALSAQLMLLSEQNEKRPLKTFLAIFLLGIFMVSLCVFAVVDSGK